MHYRRVWICVFLFTLTLINYTDRVALSVAVTPISAEFGLSKVQMGYLLSSFLWMYVICLLPVGTGVLWALGVMAAVGYPLNLLNVFVITMVIGVGSDYAIYMIHRVREGASIPELASTARAVVLSALTTIVGFGTLIMTHYPGLQSMGWMASLGVTFAVVSAVVLVPLVVRRTVPPPRPVSGAASPAGR